ATGTMDAEGDGTGVSQGVAALQMDAAPATSIGLQTPLNSIESSLLRDWLEDPQHQEAAFTMLVGWAVLEAILTRLGYHADSDDHWMAFGFALHEGPDPTEQALAARLRTIKFLCSLASYGQWAASRLPLWKELGTDATQMLRDTTNFADDTLLLKWSSILIPSLETVRIQEARTVAALMEKGDVKVWEHLRGLAVTVWTPADANALARLVSALLRKAGSADCPVSARFVSTLPLAHGMDSVENVILPGHSGPRRTRVGLAVVQLSSTGAWSPPGIHGFRPSILKVDPRSQASTPEVPRVTVDLIFPSKQPPVTHYLQLRHLRHATFPNSTFFGSTLIYGDPDAMILEFSSPRALQHCWPLCTQL
ncbi:unnamed protein product, partial [Prorocentrum cordatum]